MRGAHDVVSSNLETRLREDFCHGYEKVKIRCVRVCSIMFRYIGIREYTLYFKFHFEFLSEYLVAIAIRRPVKNAAYC